MLFFSFRGLVKCHDGNPNDTCVHTHKQFINNLRSLTPIANEKRNKILNQVRDAKKEGSYQGKQIEY